MISFGDIPQVPLLLRQGLSLAWISLSELADEPASPRDPPFSASLALGITSVCITMPNFTWVQGSNTGLHTSSASTLEMSHLPSPLWWPT